MSEISLAQQKFLLAQKKHRRTVAASRLCIFVLFLTIWECAARMNLIDSFFFSSPSDVILCAYNMLLDHTLFTHVGVTLFETISSFVLVTILALLTTIILWLNRKISETLEPYLVILNKIGRAHV